MGREKVHQSHADLKRSIYGNLAAPGAPERIDMTVAGNPAVLDEATKLGNYNQPSYRKSGGRVGHNHKAYFSEHHAYKVRGHR